MRFHIPEMAGDWQWLKTPLCRVWAGGLAVGGLLASVGGCAPEPPTDAELGQLVYDIEQMPGAHKRFLLPEIKREAGGGKAAASDAEHPPHEGHTHADDAPGDK